MSIVCSRSTHGPVGRIPRLPGVAFLLFAQLVGCAGVVMISEPVTPEVGETELSPIDAVALRNEVAEVSRQLEPEAHRDRDLHRAASPPGGRYQLVSLRDSPGWVILDTEKGKFEHWVPIAGTSRYHVFGCKFEGDCSIFDKRSVDRGFDP